MNMPIYSYAELKGKIKVGDRVRAVVGMLQGCEELGGEIFYPVKDNSIVCTITEVGEIGFSINGCSHRYFEDVFLELLTEEKTLDTVDVGDVVVAGDGDEHTVIDTSKNGVLLFLSSTSYPLKYSHVNTRQAFKDAGYTVKQSTSAPKEMTLEEVSKALGYPVKIVE